MLKTADRRTPLRVLVEGTYVNVVLVLAVSAVGNGSTVSSGSFGCRENCNTISRSTGSFFAYTLRCGMLSWEHVKPTIKLPVMMRSSYGATCGGVRSGNVVHLKLSFHCESASLIIVSGQNVM
jgi:hypothetical protein